MFILLAVLALIPAHNARQPREVIEAYRVCGQFQKLMSEDLDFDRAFEATFTRNAARRREIAITEGEFGGVDLKKISDAMLIDAFKARMQILYLMLPLVSPNNTEEEQLFFPPAIKAIFERKPPETTEAWPAYALQLRRDASDLRAHLDQLAASYPRVAERVREFKAVLAKKKELPSHVVRPLTAYSHGRVLGLHEKYYQIDEFAVIREGRTMKIIGIRFFNRLF